jgi:hypothetical protein
VRIAAAQLSQRRLAEHDRAGLSQLLGHERVAVGKIVLEQDGTERRRHSSHVELVFHDEGDAVQRPREPRLLERGVQTIGFLQRLRVDRDDRIERRTLLVVRLDAIEIQLHQTPRRQRPAFVGGVDLLDRRLEQAERPALGAALPRSSNDDPGREQPGSNRAPTVV